jgi:hypothetical protein
VHGISCDLESGESLPTSTVLPCTHHLSRFRPRDQGLVTKSGLALVEELPIVTVREHMGGPA